MPKLKKAFFENEFYIILDKTDYLNFVSKSSTKEQRKKFFIMDVYINAAVCLKCKDYIRSLHVHSFVTCSCGAVSVDGGSHYVRRSGNPEDYVDVVEYFADVEAKMESKPLK